MSTKHRTVRDLPCVMFVKNVEDMDPLDSYKWKPIASPTEGGVTLSYGHWDNATREDATHVVLNLTTWSDYGGSTVERSNERALLEDYGDTTFIRLYGGYGTSGLMLPVDRPADWFADDDDGGEDRWQALLADLAALEDYPLYSDDDHSQLEMEIADEMWDAFLRMDIASDLTAAGIDTSTVNWHLLRTRFYDITYSQDYGPECETATSCYFPFYDATVKTLIAELREDTHS